MNSVCVKSYEVVIVSVVSVMCRWCSVLCRFLVVVSCEVIVSNIVVVVVIMSMSMMMWFCG